MVQTNGDVKSRSKFLEDAKVHLPPFFLPAETTVEGSISAHPESLHWRRMGTCQKRQNFPGVWYAYNGFFADFQEPSSTEVLGYVADMSRADFVRAIEIADKGFRKYSTSTTFAERGIQLRKWFDLIQKNIDDCMNPPLIALRRSGEDLEP